MPRNKGKLAITGGRVEESSDVLKTSGAVQQALRAQEFSDDNAALASYHDASGPSAPLQSVITHLKAALNTAESTVTSLLLPLARPSESVTLRAQVVELEETKAQAASALQERIAVVIRANLEI